MPEVQDVQLVWVPAHWLHGLVQATQSDPRAMVPTGHCARHDDWYRYVPVVQLVHVDVVVAQEAHEPVQLAHTATDPTVVASVKFGQSEGSTHSL